MEVEAATQTGLPNPDFFIVGGPILNPRIPSLSRLKGIFVLKFNMIK
jgi:hypothetical protein